MHAPPHHGLTHIPGYDFLRLAHWVKEAQEAGNATGLAPYFFPLLGLIAACIGIEGYVDMVARGLDKDWSQFISTTLRLRDRLQRLYSFSAHPLDLGSGI